MEVVGGVSVCRVFDGENHDRRSLVRADVDSDGRGGTMKKIDKSLVARMKKKYVRVKQIGHKWNTYLQIDHQGFSVVEQTTKKRAEFYGKMLAIALSRVTPD